MEGREQMAKLWRQRRTGARNLFSYMYALLLVLVLAGTAVAAAAFAVGIIAGGNLGPRLAASAGWIIHRCMIGGTLAIAVGMGYVYFSGRHTLTLRDADIVDSASSKRGERVASQAVSGTGD